MADSKKYDGSQWEHSLRRLTTATETVENPLYSDGTAITAYTIKGNTVQNGTPTPSNPVEVNGVGEKTANLAFTKILNCNINSAGTIISPDNYIIAVARVKQGKSYSANGWLYAFYANEPIVGSTSYNGQRYSGDFINITAPIDGYVGIRMSASANPMINEGSLVKSYEPYGYKIPISNGQQTTNIYLGSTQTTRQVKKLVLTGNETFTTTEIEENVKYRHRLGLTKADIDSRTDTISSHFLYTINWTSYGINITNDGQWLYLIVEQNQDDFKAWLAAQYAAGTPVTIWYVLTTAETAIVNEPLMKIGTYADTLSNAASIPTTEGANTITVDTTVQPSEFTATWTGWHDSSVKEWDGSQWS